MNQLLVLAYTVGGGVIGAALNQYATNIGQRRNARATVVSKLSEVEEIYALIRWPNNDPKENITYDLHLKLEQCLHALEGAGLVAGVPRSTLSAYILICRLADTLEYTKLVITNIEHDLAIFIPKLQTYAKHPTLEPTVNEAFTKVDTLKQSCKTLTERTETRRKENHDYHDVVLDALSGSLWHPIIAKFRWLKDRQLRKITSYNEGVRRNVFAITQDVQTIKNDLLKAVDKLPLPGEQIG